MALIDYTTYDDIRACLGVTDEEIEDSTLALGLYEMNLQAELEDISYDLAGDYATVAALGSRSAVEERFYQTTRLFAAYAVAKQLCTSLPLFSPKTITDGKAAVMRHADSPYKAVIAEVGTQYERFRLRLDKAYADYKVTSVPAQALRPFLSAASPASDPVTGT